MPHKVTGLVERFVTHHIKKTAVDYEYTDAPSSTYSVRDISYMTRERTLCTMSVQMPHQSSMLPERFLTFLPLHKIMGVHHCECVHGTSGNAKG